MEMPFAHMRSPQVIEKARRRGMVSGPGDAIARATTLHRRVATRMHFGVPCILAKPGVDLLVVPQR